MLSAVKPASGLIVPARTPRDWAEVRKRLLDLFGFLRERTGQDFVEANPELAREIEDPATFYAHPLGRMFLAKVGGRVVGTTGVVLVGPAVAEVRRVWVDPDARGSGYASRMLEAATVEARRIGARRLRLTTWPVHNRRAYDTFRARGFRPMPDLTSFVGAGPDLLTMEKQLV